MGGAGLVEGKALGDVDFQLAGVRKPGEFG
jgi:hypothetical protein